MKKTTLLLMLAAALLLSACGAALQTDDTSQPADSPQAEAAQPQTTAPGASEEEQSPTFEDGDFYLEAVTKHDASLCAKIGNADLKKQCEKEAPVKN